MKILILGGTGAMGIHATKLLSGLGHQVLLQVAKSVRLLKMLST